MEAAGTQRIHSSTNKRWDKVAHEALRSLHRPSGMRYWADFLISSSIAWFALALAVHQPAVYPAVLAALVASTLALYRALCFLHELTHVRPGTLPGFQTAWNLLVGVPALMPSCIYTMGVHQNHHRIETYGTDLDPEYMPFAKSNRATAVFALKSLLVPLALAIRFLLLSPLALVLPRLHRALASRASALAMHSKYRREPTPELLRALLVWQSVILAAWGTAITLAITGILPWRIFGAWYAVMAIASLLNTLRTLGAHRYESAGKPLDRTGQLLDSVDTPGSWWTELWAPVGLRYHALHHYFPGIPYHNLPEAHRRLRAALPAAAPYAQTASPSLWQTLRRLWVSGSAKPA